MNQKLHFISGLPRSGSTLLSAILRQNPRIHAGMTSPLGPVLNACLNAMGAENEFAQFFNQEQKKDILKGVFSGYYDHIEPTDIVFDTNRMWTSRLSALLNLYPDSKVICCVRNPAWIIDSVERLVRKNALDTTRIFANANERATVYTRAEALLNQNRMIGFAWSALKEAYYGDDAESMLLVDYDILAARPKETVDLIYKFIGEEAFEHDFDNVEYEAENFDLQLIAKDLHTVRGKVELKPRRTILPPDVFKRGQDLMFWLDQMGSKSYRIVPEQLPADAVAEPAQQDQPG